MKVVILSFFLLFIFLISLGQEPELIINVHPGVELLTVVQKLSGQFPNSTPSKYEQEMLSYFENYKSDPAIVKLKGFKGNVFPDLTELGFCFSDFPNFNLHIPDSTKNWYKLYGKENVIDYLQKCKEFALKTHFWTFYTQHQNRYQLWNKPIYEGIKKDSLIEKLNSFYNMQSHPPKFYICLDPLNGWGAHAIPNPELFNPKYKDLKAYSIGFFSNNPDTTQDPSFSYGNYAINLVWHEGSHIFLEDLFTKYKLKIDALDYLFNKDDVGMKSQNISNWTYCLNENVVRGIVIALFKKYKSERAWKKQNAQEIINDFIYAEEISQIIYSQYINRKKYKNFYDFFPVLLDQIKNNHPFK